MLAFSDGYTVRALPAAQDHKRIGEGDTGLNTGGMGAYAPAPVATPTVMQRIVKEALQPTIDGMRREGWQHSSRFTVVTAHSPKAFPSWGYYSPDSYSQAAVQKSSSIMLGSETQRQKHSCFYSTKIQIWQP